MTQTALHDAASPARDFAPPPIAVQILGMILFAGFAIPVTIIALNVFWPAGVALAIILGWRGTFALGTGRGSAAQDMAEIARSLSPDRRPRKSGNASFDAYRDAMMDRLETEQENFDAFLDRLRAARDKTEFDRFMDDRAGRSRLAVAD